METYSDYTSNKGEKGKTQTLKYVGWSYAL